MACGLKKPDQNPGFSLAYSYGIHGYPNSARATPWPPGKKLNLMMSPTSAVVSFGLNAWLSLPTLMTIVLAAVALELVDVGSEDLVDVVMEDSGVLYCALALWIAQAARRPSEYEERIVLFLLVTDGFLREAL